MPDAPAVRRVVNALVSSALLAAGDSTSNGDVEFRNEGTASLIALTEHTAVRIARGRQHGETLRRSQLLVDSLPDLPFHVPRSLGSPVELEGYVAVPTMRLQGEPLPPGTGEPGPLRELLEAVHGIAPKAVAPHLAEPRAFMGGSTWADVLRLRVVPLLPDALHSTAERRIRDLEQITGEADACVNHGDLAGANVLWRNGRVTAVLDWDLTALEDPAEDLASLCWWHGWDLAEEIAAKDTVERAEVFRRTFPLQMIAFHVLAESDHSVLAAMLTRIEPALRTSD